MAGGPKRSAQSATIPPRRSERLKKAQESSEEIVPPISSAPVRRTTGARSARLKAKAGRSTRPKPEPPLLSSSVRPSKAKKKTAGKEPPKNRGAPRVPVLLSSRALIHHDLETRGYVTIDQKKELERIAHALQSETLPSGAGSEMTTYDKNLPNLLGERRVYDADVDLDTGEELKIKGYSHILQAVTDGTGSDNLSVSTADKEAWKTYHKMVSGASVSEASTIRRAFETYLEVPAVEPAPHYHEGNQKWKVEQMSTLDQYPKPDHMEGLAYVEVPVWIKVNNRISDYGHVITDMFLPNFMAEFKSEGSMKVAHTQCRLDGAFAARAWHEIHTLLFPNEKEYAWNRPFVGTMEFDADGWRCNIHWVEKATEEDESRTVQNNSANGTPLSFHMCRVAAGLSRYEKIETFLNARRKAMNFRNYFAELRSSFLKKVNKLPTQEALPAYKDMNLTILKKRCKERNPSLPTGGKKTDLIDRLKRDDERRIAPTGQANRIEVLATGGLSQQPYISLDPRQHTHQDLDWDNGDDSPEPDDETDGDTILGSFSSSFKRSREERDVDERPRLWVPPAYSSPKRPRRHKV